jgi:DNA-binding ferritin-like protein
MSEKLARIEKALDQLAERQDEICRHLAGLEQKVAQLAPRAATSTDEVIRFLDQFRAGEALGETSLGAWIAACQDACLRGGLRTVQTREGSHARLLAERIKELGGSPVFELPDALTQAALEGAASRARSDAEKVREFVARFPDVEQALQPIEEMACRLDADPETQSLLRTIACDERATLEWFQQVCAQLD